MIGPTAVLFRRLGQLWQRLLLAWRQAGPPRIRQFYTSDFIILDGALCKVFWKVENAWRLTLEPVPVPGGHAALDVTGRIYADIVADARCHTLYLHADGHNGQRVSQLLDLRPLPVNLQPAPSPVLLHRSPPRLPLLATGGRLQLAEGAHQPGPYLPTLAHLSAGGTPWRLFPHYLPAARQQQRAGLPVRPAPDLAPLAPQLELLADVVARLRQTTTPDEARQLHRRLLTEK